MKDLMMKEEQKELLIIIPAYNEEKNLGAVLDQLQALEIASVADILVMNDASVDHTADIAHEHGVFCVTHVFNLGYGDGLQIGYRFAVRRGYRYVIQMDADGQHDVCNVPALYKALTEGTAKDRPDIVLGSRYMDGDQSYQAGLAKKVAYSWFRQLIRGMTGETIADPTTGLQGLSHSTFRFYARYKHFDDRFPDANMLAQMLMLGFRVKQIPAVMHYRTEGTSMHSGIIKPIKYMARMTLSLIAVWLRIRVLKIDVAEVERLRRDECCE